MKYYLRSASTEQETAQVSNSISQAQFNRKKYKIKKHNNKNQKHKKLNKQNKKTIINRKRKTQFYTQKQTKQKNIYQKILRFSSKNKKKTFRVYCFNQRDLGIKKRFCKNIIGQTRDDDQQSWDSLIEAELQKCKKNLIRGIQKHSEGQSNSTISTSVKQQFKQKNWGIQQPSFLQKQNQKINKQKLKKQNNKKKITKRHRGKRK